MSVERRRYEVVSVSLPSDLVKRANALLPKTRRSRVIANVLASFLDAIERSKVAEEYRAYYAQRTAPEAKEERDLLAEWQLSDREALPAFPDLSPGPGDRRLRDERRASRASRWCCTTWPSDLVATGSA